VTLKRLVFIAAVIALFAGCEKFAYRMPSETFRHGLHEDILDKQGFECLDCHKFLKIEGRDFKRSIEVSGIGLYPRKAICHFCHVEPETRVGKAPVACTTCHMDMNRIKPETHVMEWKKFHAADAKKDRQSCNNCHKEWFCTDCHMKRDTIRTAMHPRPYRFFHSVEAQIDPARCGACHTIRFCIDCHSGKTRRYN
jgi:hypothetical protein